MQPDVAHILYLTRRYGEVLRELDTLDTERRRVLAYFKRQNIAPPKGIVGPLRRHISTGLLYRDSLRFALEQIQAAEKVNAALREQNRLWY
jgi:hypothetical protein